MSKLFTGKIDVTKIDKSKIFEGKKGKYINLSIWINDDVDNYGNTMSIQQSTDKGDAPLYLGNCKEFEPKKQEATPTAKPESKEEEKEEDFPF